jgi:hypothetical protein
MKLEGKYMNLSTVQKGNIIESQIANILILQSDGNISPSIPIVDDNGIDLILNLKNSFKTLFLQVKSRFITNKRYKNRLDFQVDKNKFNVSNNYYVLCVYFDQDESKIDTIWLIPSENVSLDSVKLEKFYRIVANRNENSNDKWSEFKVSQKELIQKIIDILSK